MKTAENRTEMRELLSCVEHLLADVRDTLAAIEANRKRRPVTWCQCGCVTLGDVQCPACERVGGKAESGKQKAEIATSES